MSNQDEHIVKIYSTREHVSDHIVNNQLSLTTGNIEQNILLRTGLQMGDKGRQAQIAKVAETDLDINPYKRSKWFKQKESSATSRNKNIWKIGV